MEFFCFFNTNKPDYSTYSTDSLMDFFISDNWPPNSNERLGILQEVSNRIADERGTSRVGVNLFYEDSGQYGGYNSGYRNISLNEKYLDDPYEALDTIAHETNHHVQNISTINNTGEYSNEQVSIIKGENRSGYGQSEEYYEIQDLELDSNNYAFKYVTNNHEKFKNDPQYRNYLIERQNYFDRNSEKYNNNKEYWQQQETNHINIATNNGDLTIDEANEAINVINSDNDPFKNEMLNNNGMCKNYIENFDYNNQNKQYDNNENKHSHGKQQTTDNLVTNNEDFDNQDNISEMQINTPNELKINKNEDLDKQENHSIEDSVDDSNTNSEDLDNQENTSFKEQDSSYSKESLQDNEQEMANTSLEGENVQ